MNCVLSDTENLVYVDSCVTSLYSCILVLDAIYYSCLGISKNSVCRETLQSPYLSHSMGWHEIKVLELSLAKAMKRESYIDISELTFGFSEYEI